MPLVVFFVFVQVYGWWYWLRGNQGKRPPIRTTNPWLVSAGAGAALAIAGLMTPFLAQWTQSATPLIDACTFTFSVLATYTLDFGERLPITSCNWTDPSSSSFPAATMLRIATRR